jgi:uncharacterized membrane protein YedE/YeeE
MEAFPFWAPLAGGAIIGVASALMLLGSGRIAGISGIVGGLLSKSPRAEVLWRTAFVGGLVLGGAVLLFARPSSFPSSFEASLPMTAVAGLLVGFGSRLGSGCTSGHGVCGIGRMSPRSLLATPTFIATGALAVLFVRHILGGGA